MRACQVVPNYQRSSKIGALRGATRTILMIVGSKVLVGDGRKERRKQRTLAHE